MQSTREKLRLGVNGKTYTIEADPDTPLLYILRNQLGLYGPKYGCGLGQCGSCMVLIGGQAVMSCTLSVKAAEGKDIRTLSGLVGDDGTLHPVQQAFIDEQAAQCGYCTNGMIIAAVSLLKQNPRPKDEETRLAFQNNLCRCGTQSRVLKATRRLPKKPEILPLNYCPGKTAPSSG